MHQRGYVECRRNTDAQHFKGTVPRGSFCAQAPKQGIAGALFELGSTQQEQAVQQQGIAARPGKQAQVGPALPPPPPLRPTQVAPRAFICREGQYSIGYMPALNYMETQAWATNNGNCSISIPTTLSHGACVMNNVPYALSHIAVPH